MPKKIDQSSFFFSLPLYSSSGSQLLNEVEQHLNNSSKLSYINTPNPEQVVLATREPDFLQALQQADWLIPDGIGLVWAARLLAWKQGGVAPRERVAGVWVVSQLIERAVNNNWSLLLLGGQDQSSYQSGSEKLRARGVKITWLPGYEDVKRPQPHEEAALATTLQQQRPSIVLVALGAPAQELWGVAHRELLESSGVRLVMAVGGSFDFIFGRLKRAPGWMQSAGLEWLYRLWQEPWRWKRQLRLVEFVGLTCKAFFAR